MLFSLALIASLATSALGLVYGVDSSQLVSTATFTKAKSEGFTKAIIRGYEEACSVVRGDTGCIIRLHTHSQLFITGRRSGS